MTIWEQIKQDFSPVTTILTAFAQKFDEEYSVELSSDWQADNISETIFWTFVMCESGAVSFRENFVRRFPVCADFDTFTLSFMHELGHLETEWDMVDDVKERNQIKGERDSEKYYNLYNERIATDWAGEYLTAHHDTMKTWEEKILEILKKVLDKYPDA